MARTHDEVETKYDMAADFELPPVADLLAGFGDVVDVELGGVDQHALDATYFDTADLRLFHAGLTLRRRTGGPDDGWHLKVPVGESTRREVRAPLGRSPLTVPIRLRRLVWMQTRGLPLVPIVRLETQRAEHHLVAGEQALADLADDRVTATRLIGVGDGDADGDTATAPTTWRELEVELTGGDRALLKRIGRQLRTLGATRSASGSKLARALDRSPDPGDARASLKSRRKALSPKSAAGEVIVVDLAWELQRLRAEDLSVRLDRPDSVHTMRVATRRMRSLLSIFEPLFETGRVEPLEAELKWLAGELGVARDAEVLRSRLLTTVATEQGHHLSTARVTQAVDRELARRQRAAVASVGAALDSERYHQLVLDLEELVEHPPLTARGQKTARKVLPWSVARAYSEVRRAVLSGTALSSGDERDERLHHARKKAKRARYAAEALEPAFGKEAKVFAGAMETLQSVLGERHDSVTMQGRLLELAQEASPATAFTYGRLHARESAHQAEVDASLGRVWKSAAKPSLRAWLT